MEQTASQHFKQALAKFRSRDVKGGLDDLEEALRLDPSRWEFWWTRGAFNYRRRAWTLAEADLTKAIELCPDAKQAAKIYQRRMFCFGRLKRYDGVVQGANWLLGHGFRDAELYSWRGWSKFMLGDVDGAIEDYSRVIELFPDDEYKRLDRATVYYKSKRYDDALTDLNHMLSFILNSSAGVENTPAAFIYQFRALTFYQLGEFEKSFEDYNRCQQIFELKAFTSIPAYIDTIKRSVDRQFSEMPSRPHDQYELKPPEAQGE